MKNNYTKLTKSQEHELFKEYKKTKDEKIKTLIFNKNVPFVKKVVTQFSPKPNDYDDYYSEGCMGLLNSIDEFDYTLGNKFITYSVWWINAYITKYIYQKSKTIRIPLNQMNNIRSELKNKNNFKSTINDVYEALKLNSYNIDAIINSHKSQPVKLSDILPDDKFLQPDQMFIKNNLAKFLFFNLNKLSDNEQKILKSLYGINCQKSVVAKISDDMGLTPHTINKIHNTAIKKIKKMYDKETINTINSSLNYVDNRKFYYE